MILAQYSHILHIQILSKHINKDLSNLSNWLKTNKLSLNIKKTKLVLFRLKNLKLDHSFKFKIDGKRLIPIHSVKYLGVLLDEHILEWANLPNKTKTKSCYSCELEYLKNCILFTLSISSAIWCTTTGPEKSRNQRNNEETPKLCSQKN